MADQVQRYPPKYNFVPTIKPLSKHNIKRKLNSEISPDSKWKQRSIFEFLEGAAKKLKMDKVDIVAVETKLIVEPTCQKENCSIVTIDLNYSDCESTSSSVISNIKRLNDLLAAQLVAKSPKLATTSKSVQPVKIEYNVEKILKINEISAKPHFLVKWKGYKDSDNTWEPLKNVDDCVSLKSFLRQKTNFFSSEIERLDVEIQNDNPPVYTDSVAFSLIGNFSELQLQSDLILLAMLKENNSEDSVSYTKIYKRTKINLSLLPFYLRRMEQIDRIARWQTTINSADKSSNLMVENTVDFEEPPLDFQYVNDNVAGDGVFIPDDPIIGCECGERCYSRTQCCGKNSGSLFAYNDKKRIKVPPGTPIFECNNRCSCGPTCMNRVVQQGRKHTLSIYKTENGRGWGVRTERIIYEGQFICEYVGEIITNDESEKRGKIYDNEGRTYLFDLDINSSDNPYTIDAAKCGNVSHFINHSCDPNCGVWAVWINCMDLDLPKICLFALRRIEAGEELSFDYLNQRAANGNKSIESEYEAPATNDNDGEPSQQNGNMAMECKCNSAKCRKYIF